MQTHEFWALFGMFFTIFLTMIGGFIWLIIRMDTKFEKIETKIEGIGNRINRIEERITSLENRMNHLDGMLSTIVSFLLGNRTGSGT